MQLTENDTTKDMPPQLPDDFFIPDADYDAATGDTGKPAHDVSQPTGSGTNANAPLASDTTKCVNSTPHALQKCSPSIHVFYNRTGKSNCDASCQCASGSAKTTNPLSGVLA